ncbi:hypothetical protein ARMSODRAFT_373498 [Armillaria solidipes]|uniref:Calcineurin-like phosphoesterase domain-containing protein n=1 Tax=Armillaria solidipes TaxID=1076256 RepID=A0A2H3BA88_9AGAR|nr:hypothetical protein ARMSODRAFT_373498 [Armillaria solidipes]
MVYELLGHERESASEASGTTPRIRALGPNELSIDDPAAIRPLYGQMFRSRFYQDADALISTTTDRTEHASRLVAWNKAFDAILSVLCTNPCNHRTPHLCTRQEIDRFAKFKTRKGRSVTALGVIFDFTGNDHNTTVQKVEDVVNEPWFLEAIQEEPDFFLLAGHMPVARDKWPFVFDAATLISETALSIQLDGRSMSLESGRYMETIGWMSLKLDTQNESGNLTFS